MSITVKLPDELAALLADEAARQSVTPDELAARVLAEHIPTRGGSLSLSQRSRTIGNRHEPHGIVSSAGSARPSG